MGVPKFYRCVRLLALCLRSASLSARAPLRAACSVASRTLAASCATRELLAAAPRARRWLSERYPLINQPVDESTLLPEIDNLYLDLNGARRPGACQPRCHGWAQG